MASTLSKKARIRLTAVAVCAVAFLLGAWPVSIVLRGNVKLIDKDGELRPGLGKTESEKQCVRDFFFLRWSRSIWQQRQQG
jgi:hypothetical protein